MRLVAGDAELVLAPETGGAVVSWTLAGRPVFRPANPDAPSARLHACYPLVPFSNRVADGRFRFAGSDHTLPLLLDGQAIHGAGWQCAWTGQGDTMTLDYHGGELWPFAFRAEQVFDLQPTSLAVTMRITNRHDAPAPAAIGLHPFFPRDADTELQLAATSVWMSNAGRIPVVEIPVPAAWSYGICRRLGEPELDHCFAGWERRFTLVWPRRRERLVVTATEPFGHCVVFVPKGKPFCAIEPVSNMNDGLNHMDTSDDHGMRILAPGETLEGRILMVVEPIA